MDGKNQRFKLERVSGAPVSTDELLSDLKRVAALAAPEKVSQRVYVQHGQYDVSTFVRRFGSWNLGLKEAGLELSNEVDYSDERLYENILNLWQHYGRQPRQREAGLEPSTISYGAYRRRFGSWGPALAAFVVYANADESSEVVAKVVEGLPTTRRTARDPSLQLRFKVLQRDHFRCRSCGASPALTPGTVLHVDHHIPWSRGGDTVLENLKTLCEPCNLGKSNLLPT